MTRQVLDIDDVLETPDDPRFIAGIFNYCDGRCARCRFSVRCRLYADQQGDLEARPDDHWTARVHRSFQRTLKLIQRWCEREGIDVKELKAEATSDEVANAMRIADETRQDPLQKLAEQYTFTALKLSEGLRRAAPFNTWPPDAHEALETVEWFALRVSSKVHRALTGHVRRLDEDCGVDPIQSDWNGSAKVARLEIAESRAAWTVLLTAGRAPADSPMRHVLDLLDRIEAGLVERFPHAMEFVRPGFDNPDSNASTL